MRFLLSALLAALCISVHSQTTKPPLSHSVYDSWKDLADYKISRQGELVTYEVNPQKGDGHLYWFNTTSATYDSLPRGSDTKLVPSGNYIVCRIKMPYDTVRQMMLEGKKKKDLPKDSLGVIHLPSGKLLRFAETYGYDVSKKGEDLIAFLLKQEKDTTTSDSVGMKNKKKEKKKERHELHIIRPPLQDDLIDKDVKEFAVAEHGNVIAYIRSAGDSIDSCIVKVFIPKHEKTYTLFESPGNARNITLDSTGRKVAFHFSGDTTKHKVWGMKIFYGKDYDKSLDLDTSRSEMPGGWSVSPHRKPSFTEDAGHLYFGIAPIPEPEPDDTLTEDEKVSVDIWNWKDLKLQPQQLKEAEKEKERNYLAVWHLNDDKMVGLADENMMGATPAIKKKGRYILGYHSKPYWKLSSWEATRYRDVYLVDQQTGDRVKVLEKISSSAVMSPGQDFIAWYNPSDSAWYLYDIDHGESTNVTGGLPWAFYNEEHDMPVIPGHYGFAGWTSENRFIIYDRYDLFIIDPEETGVQNLTNGYGRKNRMQLRVVNLDKEDVWIDEGEDLLLRAFNERTKASGFYSLSDWKELKELVIDDHRYSMPIKAEEAERLIWTKQNFREYPDLWISDMNFNNEEKITDVNPQAGNYRWGNVELVNWTSLNGDSLSGLLYTPEDLDTTRKYPMLVYFYEKYSDRLHAHYVPKPSRSVINFTYYVSNGYVIFIPDIVYRTGYPGQSCYDAVMAGTLKMKERPWIDEERMALQGQSWGGYQVAYLVTRTDLFAAAMAGAPVSNMTSAYGGIRWGSGLSRMFQYEESQSRIGVSLWDDPLLYLENSPVFHADKITTPLLIMHNDNDGAVPWYQGIELFVAMRRLNKPCWMLTYNNAPHNLSRRADMEDLTVRMQQFFDHFLRDDPEPVWMKQGIPAIIKGRETGFEIDKP